MVTYCDAKIITTCSPVVGQFLDTIERDDYFLTRRFRRSSSFFTKNFTAVHERLLRAPWLLFMQSLHGPFPGTTPEDMKRPK